MYAYDIYKLVSICVMLKINIVRNEDMLRLFFNQGSTDQLPCFTWFSTCQLLQYNGIYNTNLQTII